MPQLKTMMVTEPRGDEASSPTVPCQTRTTRPSYLAARPFSVTTALWLRRTRTGPLKGGGSKRLRFARADGCRAASRISWSKADIESLLKIPGSLRIAVRLLPSHPLGVKRTGKRSAGNPHAPFDVAGAGDRPTVTPKRACSWKRRTRPRGSLRGTAPALDPTRAYWAP